jgi:hypothetical protein
MAYGDFTLDEIESRFGIKNRVAAIFVQPESVSPTPSLIEALQNAAELPVRSEKARSESIVYPILVEMRKRNHKFFTIYSGDNLDVDKEQGLVGQCDFILAKDIRSFNLNYPIIQIVEAKRNDIEVGVPQCAAQLIGARQFNQKKKIEIERTYGCVTTGQEWLFMYLENDEIIVDEKMYFLVEIEELLGVFQQMLDYFQAVLA